SVLGVFMIRLRRVPGVGSRAAGTGGCPRAQEPRDGWVGARMTGNSLLTAIVNSRLNRARRSFYGSKKLTVTSWQSEPMRQYGLFATVIVSMDYSLGFVRF
ncbi:hypothetical protein VM98_38225, partial [Streptomyces rubellomurinus subsp. indigoferus]